MNQRLVIIIELLVAFGLYFWYIQPMYTGNIKILSAKITTKQTNVATIKKYLQQETRLKEKQKSISSSDIARISKMFPSTNNTARFLLNINALALRSGFVLNKFDIQKQDSISQRGVTRRRGKLYKTFTLGISGKGTYSSFRQFLGGLERSLRLVDVTDLSISTTNVSVNGNTKAPKVISYRYSLKLKIYRLPSEI